MIRFFGAAVATSDRLSNRQKEHSQAFFDSDCLRMIRIPFESGTNQIVRSLLL